MLLAFARLSVKIRPQLLAFHARRLLDLDDAVYWDSSPMSYSPFGQAKQLRQPVSVAGGRDRLCETLGRWP
jgi:hypothetical protein